MSLRVLIQIDAWDAVANAAIALRMASHDEAALCMADGQSWWPVIARLPTLRHDYFDGDFSGAISAPSSAFSCSVAPWPQFGRYQLADARLRLWTGAEGADFSAFTLRFDGRVSAEPGISSGRAEVEFAADDRWLDDPLLPTYSGAGGVEGVAALAGQVKPLALGAPRYAPGVLIDAVNNIWQLSAAGLIEGVEFALDRLVRLPAPSVDVANYSALVSATVSAGSVATCNAAGLIKHGAPAFGKTSYLVKGDKAGPGGWVRKPGAIINRIALLSGGSGHIATASLTALDSARPYNLSIYLGEQISAREVVQSIAASVNAVAGVDWLGQLFAVPIGFSTPILTLAADGTALPAVAGVEQIPGASPFWRLRQPFAQCWNLHGDGDYTAIDATTAGAFTLLPVANVDFPTPNSVRKTGAGSDWDAKAYTRESSTSGARITWVINGANQGGGLTTDPTADADWTSVDYWMQPSEAGSIGIYRNGSHLGDFGAWAPFDVLSVQHDKKTGRYYHNGAEIHSHPVNSATETISGVLNIYSPGATIADISYSVGGAAGQDGADGDTGATSAGAVINPGFETGTFENWSIVPNSGSITLQSAAGRTGTYAARIEYGSPFAPYILSNKWPCAAGQKWHISAWVRRDEAAPPNNLIQLYAIFFDAAGTQNNAVDLTTASHLISGWQLMTGEVTVPSGSPQMALDVGEAVGSGAWLVDDCFAVMRGQDGAAGYSYAELTIFKQSATAPATPTGGSYNFATKTTTPPSGWVADPSSFSGTDPVYSAKQTAAVQGATGTVSLGAWSGPGVVFASGADGQDGQSVDIVYRRSATQPATPSPSAGVPSGWYGQVADVPASADPMWQSTGERADPSSNYVWQATVKIEGRDGADGEPGADGVKTFTSETAPTAEKIGDFWVKPSTGELRQWDGTSWGEPISDVTSLAAPRVDGPPSINFSADFMGAISPSSQLPKTINISRFRGDVDVSSSTTWSIASQGPISGGTVTVSSMGVVTIPEGVSIAATGTLIIRSVRDGVTIDHQMTVSKTNAQAPNTGGSGGSGTTSTDTTLNSATTTSFVAISDVMTVKTGSAGQITLSASDLATIVVTSGALGSFPTELRWGVRPIGGSFTYQATTSDTAVAVAYYDAELDERFADDGSITNNQVVTGLSANTNYEVQLEARRTTSGTKTVSFSGTAAAVGG